MGNKKKKMKSELISLGEISNRNHIWLIIIAENAATCLKMSSSYPSS